MLLLLVFCFNLFNFMLLRWDCLEMSRKFSGEQLWRSYSSATMWCGVCAWHICMCDGDCTFMWKYAHVSEGVARRTENSVEECIGEGVFVRGLRLLVVTCVHILMGLLRDVQDCVLFGLCMYCESVFISVCLCECEACLKPSLLCHSVGGNWDLSACDFVCVRVHVCERKQESVWKKEGVMEWEKKSAVAEEWEISDRTVERDDCKNQLSLLPFTLFLFSASPSLLTRGIWNIPNVFP